VVSAVDGSIAPEDTTIAGQLVAALPADPTPADIADLVLRLAYCHRAMGPRSLATGPGATELTLRVRDVHWRVCATAERITPLPGRPQPGTRVTAGHRSTGVVAKPTELEQRAIAALEWSDRPVIAVQVRWDTGCTELLDVRELTVLAPEPVR
jgi:hypothetical protein